MTQNCILLIHIICSGLFVLIKVNNIMIHFLHCGINSQLKITITIGWKNLQNGRMGFNNQMRYALAYIFHLAFISPLHRDTHTLQLVCRVPPLIQYFPVGCLIDLINTHNYNDLRCLRNPRPSLDYDQRIIIKVGPWQQQLLRKVR